MSDNKTRNGSNNFQFANSEKVYVIGSRPDIRVPFREIRLNPTRSVNDSIEENSAVRVYDASGPYGDPNITCNSTDGLTALRREWIIARGDVEEYEGRKILPQDDGYLTEGGREYARKNERFEAF